MSDKKIVSIIVIAESAPIEYINLTIQNIASQTFKNLDIIVSHLKRDDIENLKQSFGNNLNIQYIECENGIDLLQKPLSIIKGEIVFYKSIGNEIYWFPCHIEHHVNILNWDKKAEWSFSHIEYHNWNEKDQIFNILNWRIDNSPKIESILLDELCHRSTLIPEWKNCIVSSDGGKTAFIPGLILKQFQSKRVAFPEEITTWSWVDPSPRVLELGKPISNQNVSEEVIENEGQLDVKIEFPTIVGNYQWEEHNKIIFERIKNVNPDFIKKIALKRTMGMGDIILIEPVIKALKNKYKNVQITLFTSQNRGSQDIVKYFVNKPDEIILIDDSAIITDILYNQKGYDLRFDLDLSYESRKNINYIDAYFLTTGFRDDIKEIDGKLEIFKQIDNREKVPKLFYDLPKVLQTEYVTMELFGSGWPGKEWDIEKWKTIFEEIPYKIAFISGFKNEINDEKIIYINKNNDFNMMLNLIKYAEFHIGADNGPMHIAAALDIPCFIVAGAALPTFTSKNQKIFQVNHPNLTCLHCKGRQFINNNNQGGFTFVANCENSKNYECMKELDINYVRNKLKFFIQNIRK